MPNIEIDSKKGLVQKSGRGGHLKSVGESPSIVVATNGNGTCVLSGTDTAGTITFSGLWADDDTLEVNFARSYESAPQVLISSDTAVDGDGKFEIRIKAIAITKDQFKLTSSGTCAGKLSYLVVETSAS